MAIVAHGLFGYNDVPGPHGWCPRCAGSDPAVGPTAFMADSRKPDRVFVN